MTTGDESGENDDAMASLRKPLDVEQLLAPLVTASDATDAVDHLLRALPTARGPVRIQIVLALVRLGAKSAAPALAELAGELSGSPAALVRSAALLVDGKISELAESIRRDPAVARSSPLAYLHQSRILEDAPLLFAAWLDELGRRAPLLGVSAYRTYLGDVAECAFRTLQHGVTEEWLLGASRRATLVDALAAELGGTTDFLAARGMAWLLGILAPTEDSARAAIERARDRFRDPDFAADCEAMLTERGWPPPPRLR